jgi:hypothetical protein
MRRALAAFASLTLVVAACGGGGTTASGGTGGGGGTGCKVGISWNNFQQPRWAASDSCRTSTP